MRQAYYTMSVWLAPSGQCYSGLRNYHGSKTAGPTNTEPAKGHIMNALHQMTEGMHGDLLDLELWRRS